MDRGRGTRTISNGRHHSDEEGRNPDCQTGPSLGAPFFCNVSFHFSRTSGIVFSKRGVNLFPKKKKIAALANGTTAYDAGISHRVLLSQGWGCQVAGVIRILIPLLTAEGDGVKSPPKPNHSLFPPARPSPWPGGPSCQSIFAFQILRRLSFFPSPPKFSQTLIEGDECSPGFHVCVFFFQH